MSYSQRRTITLHSLFRTLIHGDMLPAFARNARTAPVCPSFAQLQPGDPRHKIQFGRPHVTIRRIEPRDPIPLHEVMVGDALLCRDVEFIESNMVWTHVERNGDRAWREPPEVGN